MDKTWLKMIERGMALLHLIGIVNVFPLYYGQYHIHAFLSMFAGWYEFVMKRNGLVDAM